MTARREPLGTRIIRPKILIPAPLPNTVLRARLNDRLDVAAAGSGARITAPSGFGRTTLATQWAAQTAAAQVAWLTVDKFDRDPARFARHLLAAVHQVLPQDDKAHWRLSKQDLLGKRGDPLPVAHPEGVLHALLAALDAPGTRIALVLDDVDAAGEGAAGDLIEDLLRYAPARLPIVAVSNRRGQLPGPVGARGEVVEIAAADLALTRTETVQLAQQCGLTLSSDQLDDIAELTGGYPLAVTRFLAACARGAGPPTGAAASGTTLGRTPATLPVAREEARAIIGLLPQPDQQVLSSVALLGECPAPLAQRITGQIDASAVLRRLESERQLLRSEHGRFPSYRVAPWLDTYVEDAASAALDPSAVASAHRTASQWLAAENEPGKAALQAEEAGDLVAAHRLERSLGPKLCSCEPTDRTTKLARDTHAQALDQDPYIALLLLLDDVAWSTGLVPESRLAAVRDIAHAAPTIDGEAIRCVLAVLDTLRAVAGTNPQEGLQAAAKARGANPEALAKIGATPAMVATAVLPFEALFHLWNGDYTCAQQALNQAEGTREGTGFRLLGIATKLYRAILDMSVGLGPLPTAELSAMIADVDNHGWTHHIALAPLHVLTAWRDLLACRFDAAQDALTRLPSDDSIHPHPVLMAQAALIRAEISLAQGNLPQAITHHEEAVQALADSGLSNNQFWSAQVAANATRIALAHNDTDRARRQLRRLAELRPGAAVTARLRARMLAAQGEHRQARAVLAAARERFGTWSATEQVFTLLEEGHQRAQDSDLAGARRILGEALDTIDGTCGELDLLLPFWLHGEWVEPLLDSVFRHDPEVGLRAQAILAALPVQPAGTWKPPGQGTDLLSAAELDVLAQLATGSATSQVAKVRGVSVTTVRAQTRKIYRKLDVHGRGAAIRAAGLRPMPTEPAQTYAPSSGPAVLVTKARIPVPAAPLMPRHRLLRKLDTAQTRVIWVHGLPGSGRTWLLADWAARQVATGHKVAWLTLDARDADPARLSRHLAASLAAALPEPPTGLVKLAADEPPTHLDLRGSETSDATAALLLDSLADLDAPLTLVLDDASTVADTPAWPILDSLMRYGPPTLRIVAAVGTREELPELDLRLRGELTRIPAGELAFSAADAAALLDIHHVPAGHIDIERLMQATYGHPLAVAHAVRAWADGTPHHRLVDLAAVRRCLSDLMVATVLEPHTPEEQDLLIKISVADEVAGPLARRLTGRPDAAVLLDRLERNDVVLSTRETGQSEYRLIPWVRDALREEARQRLEPTKIAELHRICAHWYTEHKLVPQALEHTLAAGDPGTDLLPRMSRWIYAGEPAQAFIRITEALPLHVQESDPYAALIAARAAMTSQPWSPATTALIDRARHLAQAHTGPERTLLASMAAVLDMHCAYACLDVPRGTQSIADATAPTQAQLSAAGLPPGTTDAATRPYTAMFTLWAGDPHAANTEAQTALAAANECGFGALAAIATIHRHMIRAVLGVAPLPLPDLWAAIGTLDRARPVPRYWPVRVQLHLVERSTDACQFDQARTLLNDATWTGHRTLGPVDAVTVALAQSRLALADGDPGAAAMYAAEATCRSAGLDLPDSVRMRLLDQWCAVEFARGDLAAVTRTLRDAPPPGLTTAWLTRHEARLRAERGDARGGLQLLGRAIADPGLIPPTQRVALHLEAGRIRATRKETVGATRALRAALAATEPSIILPFKEHQSWVDSILTHAMSIEPNLIQVAQAVRAVITRHDPPSVPGSGQWSLTRAEREILQFLTGPATLRSIAELRQVSLNTIKSQARSIYRKLGVTGRDEAVRLAVDHHLIHAANTPTRHGHTATGTPGS